MVSDKIKIEDEELVVLEEVNKDARKKEVSKQVNSDDGLVVIEDPVVVDRNVEDDDIVVKFESLNVKGNPSGVEESGNESDDLFVDAAEIKKEDEESIGELLYASACQLYIFDSVAEKFVLQESSAKVSLYNIGKFDFWFAVNSNSTELGTAINTNINPTFNASKLSFIFNYSFSSVTLSYMLVFENKSRYNLFKAEWCKIFWMSLSKRSWADITKEEQNYVLESAIEIEKQLDEILDSDSGQERNISEDSEEEESEEDDEHSKRIISSVRFEESEQDKSASAGNRSLNVAFKSNRYFVVRDDKVGVFKKAEDDDMEMEFVTAITGIKTLHGKRLDPYSPMLYMEDTSLLMQEGSSSNKIFKMDLNRGEIVEEWSTGDKNVVQYCPSKKFDQTTSEQTFLGLSDKALFRIDPRLNTPNKVVQDQSKEYSTKTNFTSIGTSENGYIALGSASGNIKLYDRLGIRAKTSIPSLGQEIKHISSSADGRWLLAVCEKSLLLMDLTIKTGKNEGGIGFLKSFPAAENVKTYILTVSPEHTLYIEDFTKKSLSFTNAYFNTGIGQKEETIITSTGPFAIIWSIDKVLKNDAVPYHVRRYKSDVVEDNFEFGSASEVVVTLKNDVSLAKTENFKKPSKKVLFPNGNINDFYG
ncbi:hypothetical protein Kpol_1054p36 [Vanderwaltozyma polyspora DSM 70294]|uniref:Vacuolar import/degradation Vid27 C-terminal domain-containing protein n=1 Tax=Vanderwaltozyma polyspora (strain ATCC 22028 / DSM 70294 / BCRC 21397 / CBS 2163 / NBRC 10782 / NRRL Y-8283 / UCD 57-17) TaxID=436907 RepID=A7TIC3_VANPO|nr:uncharacterized protein Kpol_1054p36 [Vanderwaltozyma polyspora DSM 70294]EDO17989.1 hypothetical protein Kpol_1054p36 [Vanderwaltozyma polyspora DSM 70294]